MTAPAFRPPPSHGILIEAPARLHMGFLDLGGSLGRRFGSLGIAIDEIKTRVRLFPAERLQAEGPDAERALKVGKQLEVLTGTSLPARIVIDEAVPPHAGLGSGTQMALAVGTGLSQLHGVGLTPWQIAMACQRGSRSGIGIAVFEAGGLVLDAGRGPLTQIPPVIARLPMPPDWRFVILLDPTFRGLSGTEEVNAFSDLPPFPEEEAARLCHWMTLRGLPAVLENDLATFGSVITDLQRTVGDHFSRAQGGRFTSQKVERALEQLAMQGATAIGQSSWGPTGFCLVENADRAQGLIDHLEHVGAEGLCCQIGTPRLMGAVTTPISIPDSHAAITA